MTGLLTTLSSYILLVFFYKKDDLKIIFTKNKEKIISQINSKNLKATSHTKLNFILFFERKKFFVIIFFGKLKFTIYILTIVRWGWCGGDEKQKIELISFSNKSVCSVLIFLSFVCYIVSISSEENNNNKIQQQITNMNNINF